MAPSNDRPSVKVTFLTGGARCGKSSVAVELAKAWDGPVTVVVTARAGDEEMAARIESHRAHRPEAWTTVEAPVELEAAVADLPDDSFAIVDCLTLWVSNLLEEGASDDEIQARARACAAAAAAHPSPVVVVTNEVGSGIVPMNELARRFRDVHGRVNALWAEIADDAFLVVAGRVLRLEVIDAR
jgi:adenosylcobinamide kinase / adenosylcobinamide-phosphate guanylyltransferase